MEKIIKGLSLIKSVLLWWKDDNARLTYNVTVYFINDDIVVFYFLDLKVFDSA